jgi:hypothetical protein
MSLFKRSQTLKQVRANISAMSLAFLLIQHLEHRNSAGKNMQGSQQMY